MTEELLNQKRVDYLKTMQEVTNEINKRSTILETEQKYLRGEILEEEHEITIRLWLLVYSELDYELLSINTVEDFKKYIADYDKLSSQAFDEASRKIEKEDGIIIK